MFADCKLSFYSHVDYIFFARLKLLGLINYASFSPSAIRNFLISYSARVWYEAQSSSIAWNSITLTNSYKLERTERKFACPFHNRHFTDIFDYKYDDRLNLPELQPRQRFISDLFLISIFKIIVVIHPYLMLRIYMYLIWFQSENFRNGSQIRDVSCLFNYFKLDASVGPTAQKPQNS
jgi:hypothetical protein